MNDYIQIEFPSISAEQREILIARLTVEDFEGFEETETSLKAFVPEKDYDENIVGKIAREQLVTFNKTVIEETNWNQVWESNFDPVLVDDFVKIRADFHEPAKVNATEPFGLEAEHEIIVTPKMSFGTGHHATTFMMIQQMREIDFAGKKVFDFGTGTGVLAILAEKLGAQKIVAIDNDDWSIQNAGENIQRNNCSLIDLRKANAPAMDYYFDIIVANINKNVILENFHPLVNRLSRRGVLLLSGLIKADENDIFRKSSEYSLQLMQRVARDNWLCLRFSC